MTLAKNFRQEFVPAVPGVVGQPARVECASATPPGAGSGGGSFQQQCSKLVLPVGTSYPTGMGETVTVVKVENGYIELRICAQVWVPND